MKAQFLIIFIPVLLLAACKTGPKRFADNPDAILGKEKMVKVLTDISLAEGALSVKSFPKDSADSMARGYYQEVLDEHDVKTARFRKSMTYYIENPDILIEIQKGVVESLSAKEGREWDIKNEEQ